MSTSLTLWTVPFIKQLLQFFVLRYAIFYQWPVQSVHSPDKCHQKSFLVHLIQAKSHAASKKGKLCCLSTMTESNIKMDLFWGQNITQIMHLFSGLLKKKKIPLANDLRSGMTVLSFLFFYPSFFTLYIYLFIFATIGWLVILSLIKLLSIELSFSTYSMSDTVSSYTKKGQTWYKLLCALH